MTALDADALAAIKRQHRARVSPPAYYVATTLHLTPCPGGVDVAYEDHSPPDHGNAEDDVETLLAHIDALHAAHAAAIAAARADALREAVVLCDGIAEELDGDRDCPEAADGAGECCDAIGVLLSNALAATGGGA